MYNGWFGIDGFAVSLCLKKRVGGEEKVNVWEHIQSQRKGGIRRKSKMKCCLWLLNTRMDKS